VTIGAGAGIDRAGRLISLSADAEVEFARLVASSDDPAASAGLPPSGAYIVSVSRQPQLAGNAEILGRLCKCGCGTATDRPTAVDGVRISARPLPSLTLPPAPGGFADESRFLRSRIASAYFEDERDRTWTPLSGQALAAATWGFGESPDAGTGTLGLDVGVVFWNGSSVAWYDDWIARRDLMETRPHVHWANQFEQRPWSVFMAQVLQFQSQLASTGASAVGGGLTAAGFVAVPSAGYLRVTPTTATALRRDLEALFGPGVDLRVCAVRRDQIAHEFERAQHMDRVSLVRGLSDPANRQLVDVLVPDGVVEASTEELSSHGFAVDVTLPDERRVPQRGFAARAAADPRQVLFQGVGRFDTSGGISIRAAVAGTDTQSMPGVMAALSEVVRGETSFPDAVGAMRGLPFDTEAPSGELLRRVARATAEGAAVHRVKRSRARFVTVPEARSQVGAMAGSLWIGSDPFAMADAAQTVIRGTWDQLMPRTQPLGNSVAVDGTLLRLFSRAGSAGETVTVQVNGLATVTGSGIDNEERIQFERRLELTRDQVGQQAVVTVVDVASQETVTARWQGSPIEATGDLSLPDRRRPEVQASFAATETQAIYQPGNEYRDAAISGLQILAGLKPKDASYFDDNLALLFPARGIDIGRSVIRPIYDWVLFRRRRREECEGSAVPADLSPARVAVWVATAANADQAEQYRRFLLSGSGTVPWSPTAVQNVIFDPGTATLRSSASAWRERYEAARGGDSLVLAAFAKSPSSTELPVGLPRAHALVAATAPSATMDPDGNFEILPNPPAAQMSIDTDGSIFLIGYPTDAIEIIAADTLDDPALQQALEDGDVSRLAAAPSTAFTPLARSNRSGELIDPTAADVVAQLADWQSRLESLHDRASALDTVIWTEHGVGGARSNRATDRAKAIITEIGLNPASAQVSKVNFAPAPGVVARVYVTIVQA
jgi:hypothetical protein